MNINHHRKQEQSPQQGNKNRALSEELISHNLEPIENINMNELSGKSPFHREATISDNKDI